ncbi:MAG: tRNA preQ1(34) S-adenosylmethionine ribosyltransferase-isomerase QueA [Desulfobacteraceae bacterium]|nr:tRNA preQ1(34) S-adenosylmethionine ribosyltransferase-isomerase QueA [Desulfobacteraceae bacterium]
MYSIKRYNFELPEERIAQSPSKKRDESRLLLLKKKTGSISHFYFKDVIDLLKKGDLLVVNNTKVIPARLKGKKETGGKVEVLIIDYAQGIKNSEKESCFECDCMVKASRSPKKGARIFFEQGLEAVIIENKGKICKVRFDGYKDFNDTLSKIGDIPLPPYIKRENGKALDSDKEQYQTVYAQKEGAVAAPTAGLHFTDSLIKDLLDKGVEIVNITLHVGYGTFVPVEVEDIRDHKIHSEFFSVSDKAAKKINQAKDDGRRVITVGTTSMRTLEYLADIDGKIKPSQGMCDIFIYPGYKFKCVDAMITNFHLPESTLMMLVSAFAGHENILEAYKTAITEKYRFFSYGDAMLIED